MTILSANGTIVYKGKYIDGGYFKLTGDHRDLVDERTEDICIATKLLSLSSNKKFGGSKQELRNDLVKEKYNYPRTVLGVLKFLQFHNLQADKDTTSQNIEKKQYKTTFMNDGNNDPLGKLLGRAPCARNGLAVNANTS